MYVPSLGEGGAVKIKIKVGLMVVGFAVLSMGVAYRIPEIAWAGIVISLLAGASLYSPTKQG